MGLTITLGLAINRSQDRSLILQRKFVAQCSRCHSLGLNVTPDLRQLSEGLHAQFNDIVLHGLLAAGGMERFDDELSEKDVDDIHAYLIDQAWIAYRAQESATQKPIP